MKKNCLLTGIAVTLMALSACNDETLNIGKSLTPESDRLVLSKADYNVSTRTLYADSVVRNNTTVFKFRTDSVLYRSSFCYLGRVKDPETGAYITSEFTTQFNILETFSLPKADSIFTRYNDLPAADSCRLEFYLEDANNVTDTLAAMKIRVTEMAKPMEEDQKYYSNYDPEAQGLLRKDGIAKDKMFSYNDLTVKDSIRNVSGYYNFINVRLNEPYTDKDGVEYNNYGTYIMQMYYKHPEYFKNSYAFIHNVCPGFYVSVRDGEGFYSEIPDMALRLYYQKKTAKQDSTITTNVVLAGTEEVLQTTKITTETDVLKELEQDNTCTYIKAPAGLYTEVKLPIDEIYSSHENDSILSASINFQRINYDFVDNSLHAPRYILMVPKDSIYSFFEKEKLPDNKLTYCATFSSSTNIYSFSNISTLITELAAIKRRNVEKYGQQWLNEHPNWDKMLLVPVQAATTTASGTTTISSYEHCVGIASTKLVGGSQNPYEPIKLNILYGHFK